jgi:hypothetical protein
LVAKRLLAHIDAYHEKLLNTSPKVSKKGKHKSSKSM